MRFQRIRAPQPIPNRRTFLYSQVITANKISKADLNALKETGV